jgi:translation elongation factor EF-G
MTQGRGSFAMKSSHYDEAPAHITQKVVENRAKQEEK